MTREIKVQITFLAEKWVRVCSYFNRWKCSCIPTLLGFTLSLTCPVASVKCCPLNAHWNVFLTWNPSLVYVLGGTKALLCLLSRNLVPPPLPTVVLQYKSPGWGVRSDYYHSFITTLAAKACMGLLKMISRVPMGPWMCLNSVFFQGLESAWIEVERPWKWQYPQYLNFSLPVAPLQSLSSSL